jgi:hypothetical protein
MDYLHDDSALQTSLKREFFIHLLESVILIMMVTFLSTY